MKRTFLFLVSILTVSCNPKDGTNRLKVSLENEPNQDTIAIQNTNRSTLDKLLDQAVKENKNLFLVFGFEKCGWCKVFKLYHNDPAVVEILSKYFIVSEIDYDKTPGGMDLYRKYGSTGFPSWAVLDQTGKVLSDSEAPMPGVKDRTYNVGYPVRPHEMSWYFYSLKSAAPLITPNDCIILQDRLSYYHQIH